MAMGARVRVPGQQQQEGSKGKSQGHPSLAGQQGSQGLGGGGATKFRGQRRPAAIRKNVLRHARGPLPLLHIPGPALGPVPLDLAGGAMATAAMSSSS